MYCGLYNSQYKNFKKRITGSTTRNVKNFYTMDCRQRHFGLFIMSKMGILKNYGDAGSRQGGARRITRNQIICLFYNF